jgi:hypothetical protein
LALVFHSRFQDVHTFAVLTHGGPRTNQGTSEQSHSRGDDVRIFHRRAGFTGRGSALLGEERRRMPPEPEPELHFEVASPSTTPTRRVLRN